MAIIFVTTRPRREGARGVATAVSRRTGYDIARVARYDWLLIGAPPRPARPALHARPTASDQQAAPRDGATLQHWPRRHPGPGESAQTHRPPSRPPDSR